MLLSSWIDPTNDLSEQGKTDRLVGYPVFGEAIGTRILRSDGCGYASMTFTPAVLKHKKSVKLRRENASPSMVGTCVAIAP